jgi:hypothetical protein
LIAPFKDETGKRYGRLTVVEKVERDLASRFKRASAKWLCRCDCGTQTRVFGSKLRKGEVKSCVACKIVEDKAWGTK